MTMERRDDLTSEEAALVFRRAAEIDSRQLPAGTQRLDLTTLEQVGAEAGLSPESIRQAVVELRAGALTRAPEVVPARRGRASLPQLAVVERSLAKPPWRVAGEIERFLGSQCLRVKRRFAEATVWEPATGVVASLRRGLDLNHRLCLNDVGELRAAVVEAPGGGWVHVRFQADLGPARQGSRAMTAVGGAVGLGGAAAAVVLTGADPVALASVPAGAALAGAAYAGGRKTYRNALERVTTGLERFLDELEFRR